MKSIKHIKEQVTDHENLYRAYLHARRNKRFREEVLEFSANLEDHLYELQKTLRDQTYRPGAYKKRVIHDPVDRLIMWQAFIHRVVQWAVYQIINPEFVRSYIEHLSRDIASYTPASKAGARTPLLKGFSILWSRRGERNTLPGTTSKENPFVASTLKNWIPANSFIE